jgi:hypothetical protein
VAGETFQTGNWSMRSASISPWRRRSKTSS